MPNFKMPSKKASPKGRAAPQQKMMAGPSTPPPMNPGASGMAQIPFGQQVVPRPPGMTSLGIGGDSLSGVRLRERKPRPMLEATPQLGATPTAVRNVGGMGGELTSTSPKKKIGIGSSATRHSNPMLAARRRMGKGSDVAADKKMSPKELKADIDEDRAILKKKVGTGSAGKPKEGSAAEERTESKRFEKREDAVGKGSASSKEERAERKRGIPEGKTLGGKSEPPDDKKVGKGAAKKNWIAGAIKRPGALHRNLHVPEGKTIPAGKMAKAASGSMGPKVQKEANLARTLKKMH